MRRRPLSRYSILFTGLPGPPVPCPLPTVRSNLTPLIALRIIIFMRRDTRELTITIQRLWKSTRPSLNGCDFRETVTVSPNIFWLLPLYSPPSPFIHFVTARLLLHLVCLQPLGECVCSCISYAFFLLRILHFIFSILLNTRGTFCYCFENEKKYRCDPRVFVRF